MNVDKLLADIVRETVNQDWKHTLEGIEELASVMKSSGAQKQDFDIVMAELHAEIEVRSDDPDILGKLAFAIKNKEHFSGRQRVMVVH